MRLIILLIMSFFFCAVSLLGCTTKGEPQSTRSDDLAVQSSDSPLGPPGVFTITRKPNSDEIVIKSEKQEGFEGTLQKMANDPLTLYWRETNAYTYSIGDEFVARFQPDTSLTLNDKRNPNTSLVCQYNMQGDLDMTTLSPERLKAQQKACADLMFTFDNQLSE